jgi:cytoplasmic iron level regulating protein YaaA (DUF328/UPF0246 family)
MIALLSPAKRLKELDRSEGPADGTRPPFMAKARKIMQDHARKEVAELVRLHKVSEEIARLNRSRNAEWLSRDGQGMVRAGDLFDGEVYRGLATDSWSAEDWQYAQKKVFILSGLYGVLRPMDLVLPYRLEMGSRMSVGQHKDLYSFWAGELPQFIFDVSKNAPIIDLSSAEYIKAADSLENRSLFHKVDFLEDKRDGTPPRSIQVHLKKARGLLAHFIVRSRVGNLTDLRSFNTSGYSFDPGRSSGTNTVFLRSI